MDIRDSTLAIVLTALGTISGFGGAMAYVGGSLRQVENNTQAINEIRDHGTGLLQALKLQVQVIDSEVNNIKHDFRPREYWEGNAATIATMQARIGVLEKGCPR